MTDWKPTEINEGQPVNYNYTFTGINSIKIPKPSNWSCYMFGNRPGGSGIIYTPEEGKVPNRFVRWMMKLCFDCIWVKNK